MQLSFLDQYFYEILALNFEFKSFPVEAYVECPKQPNSFDCGVFLINNCVHGSITWFDQSNVRGLRLPSLLKNTRLLFVFPVVTK